MRPTILHTHFFRPPWRTIYSGTGLLIGLWLTWTLYSPGEMVTDGRHDRGRNGLWIQHGWLGHDSWFERQNGRVMNDTFRKPQALSALASNLRRNRIHYVYPHVCPCVPTGEIAAIDSAQAENFLDSTSESKVLPWIGGVFEVHAWPDDQDWRRTFVRSAVELMANHPRFAGIHLNIEPMPDGHTGFLKLLQELRSALPREKILSVAAYPPPTVFHRVPEVHWSESYTKRIAAIADQMVFMLYDTALQHDKLYIGLMRSWTKECIDWCEPANTEVLLGLPAYEDANTGYHHPHVENLDNGLAGIHAGLLSYSKLPSHYSGAAIYCEWEIDSEEWRQWQREFLQTDSR